MGCVYYYVLTKGRHPFGDTLHRQANIISGNYHLNGFEETNELAAYLIERMIDIRPSSRPLTEAILKHPLFWNEPKILTFFQDVSDRIEKEDVQSDVIKNLESRSWRVIRGDWRIHVDDAVAQNLRMYRNYRGNSVRDLLRAVRNKKHHYRELTEQAQKSLGEIPSKFVHYWTSRFPLLLIHTWLAMQCVKNELMFSDYYENTYQFPDLSKKCVNRDFGDLSGNRILQPNGFLGRDILKHRVKTSQPDDKGKVENWREEKVFCSYMDTPLDNNNPWFQDWLRSNCTDQEAFGKWRYSEIGTNSLTDFPVEMTQEICDHFRKKLAGQRTKPRIQNYYPKRRPKKPVVRRPTEENSFLHSPS